MSIVLRYVDLLRYKVWKDSFLETDQKLELQFQILVAEEQIKEKSDVNFGDCMKVRFIVGL